MIERIAKKMYFEIGEDSPFTNAVLVAWNYDRDSYNHILPLSWYGKFKAEGIRDSYQYLRDNKSQILSAYNQLLNFEVKY